jgi:K+-transporting ATPase ATPase C chain
MSRGEGENMLKSEIRPALVILALLTAVTGAAYPLLSTGIAQAVFPGRANGSLLLRDGRTIGSSLIGQPFGDPRYFWGRLSATAPSAYNAAASSGSNVGLLNPAFAAAAQARLDALRAADPGNVALVPVDLVTASGSGLDPHISPAAALHQVPRVARARGLEESALSELVRRHIERRQFGILGEPRVNVLRLNLALEEGESRGP